MATEALRAGRLLPPAGEDGSALTEAALLLPVLVLLLFCATALCEVAIVRLKAAEAARFALWQTTVFIEPPAIAADVQARFADLRSPESIRRSDTGLLSFPRAGGIRLTTALDVKRRTQLPGASALLSRLGFDGLGRAEVRVSLSASASGSKLFAGGELVGDRGGDALGRPALLNPLRISVPAQDEEPLTLVFDPWRAWPKPLSYGGAADGSGVSVSPALTYPVVEEQLSQRVRSMAFAGLRNNPALSALDGLADLFDAGLGQALLGGRLPAIFSTEPGGTSDGPLRVLPPEPGDRSFVPGSCLSGGRLGPCATHRLGTEERAGGPAFQLADEESVGAGVDRSRYTLPYRIQSTYWLTSGGTDAEAIDPHVAAQMPEWTQRNGYTETYACRGHFFAGAQTAQQADSRERYGRSCR